MSNAISRKIRIEPLSIGRGKTGPVMLVRRQSGEDETLALAGSRDGVSFSKRFSVVRLLGRDKKEEDISACSDFRLGGTEDDPIMTYCRRKGTKTELCYAGTKDRRTWLSAGAVPGLTAAGVLFPAETDQIDDIVYSGGTELTISRSRDLKNWTTIGSGAPDRHFFDGGNFTVMNAWQTRAGILVAYQGEIKNDILADVNLCDHKIGEERFIKIGAALFDTADPGRLLWHSELPLLELPLSETKNFKVVGMVPLGALGENLRIYLRSNGGQVAFFDLPEEVVTDHYERLPVRLAKNKKNPILVPTDLPWERDGAFNPTAVDLSGEVHLLYRAVGEGGFSFIGYASSQNGVDIDERLPYPVYKPREAFEGGTSAPLGDAGLFASGGSWGGCEDPKLTRIEDTIYLTYVAHNGTWPMRTALTSISVADFLAKRWNWSRPELLSAPNVGSKSVVILPEKVDGQYVIFHRLWPNIVVDIVPELEFGPSKRWLSVKGKIPPRRSFWDSQKLSLGAAPIKTERGWLAVYNAVDRRDSSRYKIGAMLLDAKDPLKVIARSRQPLLSPDKWYENDGKPGIAYPGGAVERDGQLSVYYGGADRVSCVATIPTDELLWHLERDKTPAIKMSAVRFA
jgi:predicted GH43/DUF377 family glycosyl hydrolase